METINRKNDDYLLRNWKKISPKEGEPNDVSFSAGATDSYVPLVSVKPQKKVDKITIASWNVENLFLTPPKETRLIPLLQTFALSIKNLFTSLLNDYVTEKDHAKENEFSTEGEPANNTGNNNDNNGTSTGNKPENQLIALAQGLKEVDADIVALQEVNSMEDLDKFQKKYMGEYAYPFSVLVEGNTDRGIDVALLSKFPIKRIYTHRDFTFPVEGMDTPGRFSRDLLEAIVQVTPKYPLKFFVTHSKSQIGEAAAAKQRNAEAKTIHQIIDKHLKNDTMDLIFAGDLNDTPESFSIKHIKGNSLSDLLELEGKENEPTHHSKQYGDARFDYIMTPLPTTKYYIKGSAKVVHNDTVHKASDHDPVIAEFKVPS